MGEPLTNLDRVLRAIEVLSEPSAQAIDARNITVCTAGLPAGIRMLARKVHKVARTAPLPFAQRFVGHVVRMQEEIGTGGGGFRFLYGAFLQEAGVLLGNANLQELALQMIGIGDVWRDFAYDAARMSKGRLPLDGAHLAAQLNNLAEREAALFRAVRAEANA